MQSDSPLGNDVCLSQEHCHRTRMSLRQCLLLAIRMCAVCAQCRDSIVTVDRLLQPSWMSEYVLCTTRRADIDIDTGYTLVKG